MLEIDWYKEGIVYLEDYNIKFIEYDEYINKDDVYDLICDKLNNGYHVLLKEVKNVKSKDIYKG